ncbi:MAG: methylated-DNA--[protein]-cysteine S-methyltransferase [Actinobacteria bacterium]|uniref:methylated-DNA--[protein]-cysteine S-methyltransferase n=1 Tax=freshwater metagenome TaxID=449393 RepID=A0A6J6F735_9ZZZZ|nr:methylated-DNA--[protein]-cysteine S-methyltransferase [Actinomycetota bacterium]
MPLLISQLKSPIGVLNLLTDDQILLGLNLSNVKALKDSISAEDFAKGFKEVNRIPVITELLSQYFDGDISAINGISVRQPGAPFSQAAWKAMRKVKSGKVLSYADLAERAGSPAAVRAAGSACAKNAIALVIPCHRIVKTGGALGNYAYGLGKKEWLLAHEGAL